MPFWVLNANLLFIRLVRLGGGALASMSISHPLGFQGFDVWSKKRKSWSLLKQST